MARCRAGETQQERLLRWSSLASELCVPHGMGMGRKTGFQRGRRAGGPACAWPWAVPGGQGDIPVPGHGLSPDGRGTSLCLAMGCPCRQAR